MRQQKGNQKANQKFILCAAILLGLGLTGLQAQEAITVTDINGKVLESKILYDSETIIMLNNFASAAYFLKVIRDKKEVKTFKIIKY